MRLSITTATCLSVVLASVCLAETRPVFAAPLPEIVRAVQRPLIIIVPGDQETASGVASIDQADGETLSMRAMRAAGKVRDYLNDSNTVEATLYSPDAPLFVRAALEAKLKIAQRYALSGDEQVSLAKAAGAIYIAVVGIRRPTDGGDGYEMILRGVETTSRKSYSDSAKYIVRRPDDKSGDSNAIRVETTTSPKNALNSAANTLVTRLLNGPLAAYGRVAPPPVLPAVPPPDTTPEPAANAEADAVTAALQQSNALLADGNLSGAITLLRRTINQSPLNLKLRLLLAQTYLAAHRNGEAGNEVKRALMLIDATEGERKEATALLSEAFQQGGNTGAARATYEDIIATQPNATWARLALADLIRPQQPEAAEAQYRAVLQADPGNTEAARGLGRVVAVRGDLASALTALTTGTDASAKVARANTVGALVEEFAAQLAASLRQNRLNWDAKQITREVFYKATMRQAEQADSLVKLLKATAVPETDSALKKAYEHRLLAASLLSQAAVALQTFLETGDKEAGANATLWLTESQKELNTLKK